MAALFGWEVPGTVFSLPSNIDMSNSSNAAYPASYQYCPVTVVPATGTGIDTPSAAAPVAASGDPMVGILQNNPQLAEAATIMMDGVSKALLGGTVTIGQQLMATPLGGLQVATSGKNVVAVALDSGSAGDIIAVQIAKNGKV
jgi:hypothetical protein